MKENNVLYHKDCFYMSSSLFFSSSSKLMTITQMHFEATCRKWPSGHQPGSLNDGGTVSFNRPEPPWTVKQVRNESLI